MDSARLATPRATILTRRAALRGLGAGLVGGSLGSRLTRSAVAQAIPAPLTNFSGETFVGETSVPGLLIAVVLAETEARAYFCDGDQIGEWLLGTVSGEALELSNEAGAQLDGSLTETGVAGAATLPDGTSLTFAAVPAAGVGGLYTITTYPDYRMKGASSTGGGFEGVLADRPITTPEGAAYLAAGILTPAVGEPVAVALRASNFAGESSGRLIALNGEAGSAGRSGRRRRDVVDSNTSTNANDSGDDGERYTTWEIDF